MVRNFLVFFRDIIARSKSNIVQKCNRSKIASGQNVNNLLIFAALGPFIFQAASEIIQPFQAHYNMFHDAISSLVFGPYGWAQTGAFYLFGITLIILAISLVLKFKVKFNLGTLLLALAGIGFILIGINHAQAPGAPMSISALIHQNTTIAVVLLFPLACFFMAPALQKEGHSGLFYYTIFAGSFAFAFFFIGGQVLVSRMSFVGLYERVLLWNGQLWMEITCIFLLINEFRNKSRQTQLPINK